MPGPPPKPPSLRQRRNKAATRATLPSQEASSQRDVPPLPPRGRGRWHPAVVSWWEGIWHSPMAEEWLEADVFGLHMIADLRQRYATARKAADARQLAAEIRQQEVRFGLSPIDRRRLQWEVDKGEEAQERTRQRRQTGSAKSARAKAKDPRDLFKVVAK